MNQRVSYNELIEKLNIKRHVFFECDKNKLNVFSGNVVVNNKDITLIIEFPENFPLHFPDIYTKEHGYIHPHINYKTGKICLFDDTSLLIDTKDKFSVLLDGFDRALEILSIVNDREAFKNEIVREYYSYWQSRAKDFVYTNLTVSGNLTYYNCKMVLCNNISLVSNSVNETKDILKKIDGCDTSKCLYRDCTVIKLREFVLPALNDNFEYNWKWLRGFIRNHITSSQKKKFDTFLSLKQKNIGRYILLVIPSDENDIILGFYISGVNNSLRSIRNLNDCNIRCVYTQRLDYEYLLKRSGNLVGLRNKRILLLGCGSIGGYVASNLCQIGVCEIDIVDQDVFSFDNIHRHILGFNDASKSKQKSDLLKVYLENNYPNVKIRSTESVGKYAERLLLDTSRLRSYDLIISALGEPTINLELDSVLMRNRINVPFIVCFNEPYGIGGHVICSNVKNDSCLRCLYTDIVSNDLAPFVLSFVDVGQDFKKTLSGCSGNFVAYSGLDSQQTALITAKTAMEILSNEISENLVVSWIGSSKKLEDNGFRTSEYYEQKAKEGIDRVLRCRIEKNKWCTVCN